MSMLVLVARTVLKWEVIYQDEIDNFIPKIFHPFLPTILSRAA